MNKPAVGNLVRLNNTQYAGTTVDYWKDSKVISVDYVRGTFSFQSKNGDTAVDMPIDYVGTWYFIRKPYKINVTIRKGRIWI